MQESPILLKQIKVTANATSNATAPHSMLATGNPIVALFAVCAVLGGYAVLRRK